MFWKLLKLLAWLAFLVSLSAGAYLFTIGGNASYMCVASRWTKAMAPVIPLPIGFCGIKDMDDPRNLPPPRTPEAPDASIYFKRKSAYGEYPYHQTFTIGPNCRFDPQGPQMKGNTTITWVNQDDKPHAIVGQQASGSDAAMANFQSQPIPAGGQYKMFINQSGDFIYHCADIPSSRGTFTVVDW